MLLYHGTKEDNLEELLSAGIRPRMPGADGNFTGTTSYLKSKDGVVYLASWCPLQYATMAKGAGRPLILEVAFDRLCETNMLPDEDMLLHELLRAEGVPQGPEYLKAFARRINEMEPRLHRERWRELLDKGGSVAHEGVVPVAALTRYALLDLEKGPVFAELVGAMLLRARTGQSVRTIVCGLNDYIFEGNPALMLDGMITSQAESLIANLTTEWPSCIHIVNLER
jgi:hypothetical protein